MKPIMKIVTILFVIQIFHKNIIDDGIKYLMLRDETMSSSYMGKISFKVIFLAILGPF